MPVHKSNSPIASPGFVKDMILLLKQPQSCPVSFCPESILFHFEIAGSIKRDVNKKTSPSAGSREIFCLDIQPTVCRWLSIAREVLLWIALPFPRFISGGDSARRFLKLGKRFNSVATMVLSEARGLSLFLVLRGGIA
jgi:hypothetical protein